MVATRPRLRVEVCNICDRAESPAFRLFIVVETINEQFPELGREIRRKSFYLCSRGSELDEPVAKHRALFASDLLAPRDESRTAPALDDLVVHASEGVIGSPVRWWRTGGGHQPIERRFAGRRKARRSCAMSFVFDASSNSYVLSGRPRGDET